MKIGFVGAGKVGTNLARYFASCGLTVSGFFVRTDTSAAETPFTIFKNLETLIEDSDVVLLTVRDDEIAGVAERIAGLDRSLAGKAFGHTSGSRSVADIEILIDRGAEIFAMHPLQTFNSKQIDFSLMKSMHLFVENGGAKPVAAIIKAIENPAHEIRTKDKARYHLAASVISNLTTALLDLGFGIMEEIGVEREDSRQAFQSLMEGTIGNVLSVGTQEALTGPIKRGDAQTVEKHLAALSGDDEIIYRLLGLRALALAEDSLEEESFDKLNRILREDDKDV